LVTENKGFTRTMKEQEQKLIQELESWQGNNHQIDDIIFVGIEL